MSGDPAREAAASAAANGSLDAWIAGQFQRSIRGMLASVSPVGILKERPGFGQTIRPVRGAIVASPVLADWNPEPDYFFHWFRDSAVVIESLRLLHESGQLAGQARRHFEDFVSFSLALRRLEGRALVESPAWRAGVRADFRKFVRGDAELAAITGDRVVADTRVNADGTLDISNWSRPQHDGAPLRALAVIHWTGAASFAGELAGRIEELIRADLAFTRAYWREPSVDIWEEESGHHYYTLCVSAAALEQGARWLAAANDTAGASACRDESREIRRVLDGYWLPAEGFYRSRVLASGARSTKELDISVILAAIHAGLDGPGHSVRDPRMHATLAHLEALFDSSYRINRDRPAERGPAMGRYAGDVYFSGGAYYFSTLGAAEFCFLAARHGAQGADWVRRGDAYLRTVRQYTPPSGELSEQFDRDTGRQSSARELAWSHAAFISCTLARRRALAAHLAPGR